MTEMWQYMEKSLFCFNENTNSKYKHDFMDPGVMPIKYIIYYILRQIYFKSRLPLIYFVKMSKPGTFIFGFSLTWKQIPAYW